MPENERFSGLFDRLLAADGGDLDWNVTGECCIAAIFLAREEREKGVEEFVFLFLGFVWWWLQKGGFDTSERLGLERMK